MTETTEALLKFIRTSLFGNAWEKPKGKGRPEGESATLPPPDVKGQ